MPDKPRQPDHSNPTKRLPTNDGFVNRRKDESSDQNRVVSENHVPTQPPKSSGPGKPKV
tara:strand:- start:14050 stop:14226 length:177 start_codon:yes stop_codon:yes gene_type:complete